MKGSLPLFSPSQQVPPTPQRLSLPASCVPRRDSLCASEQAHPTTLLLASWDSWSAPSRSLTREATALGPLLASPWPLSFRCSCACFPLPATEGFLWPLSHRHPGDSTPVAGGRWGVNTAASWARGWRSRCVSCSGPQCPSCPQCHLLQTAFPSLPHFPVLQVLPGVTSQINQEPSNSFLRVGLWGDTNEDITGS